MADSVRDFIETISKDQSALSKFAEETAFFAVKMRGRQLSVAISSNEEDEEEIRRFVKFVNDALMSSYSTQQKLAGQEKNGGNCE